jgi:hypothetical protein
VPRFNLLNKTKDSGIRIQDSGFKILIFSYPDSRFLIPASSFILSLPLLVTGVGADDPHHPFSFHDLALVTDFSNGSSHFHPAFPFPPGAVPAISPGT